MGKFGDKMMEFWTVKVLMKRNVKNNLFMYK